MNEFERQWMQKLSNGLKKIKREDIYNDLLEDKESLSDVKWTNELMQSLKQELTSDEIADVMTGCACTYPNENLTHLREDYELSGDIRAVHNKLQQQFETFIRKYKDLDDKDIEFLIENGWGMAGKLEEDRIVAIKIPKEYHKYFKTDDRKQKAYYYCHCPRIRESLLESEKPVDVNFCYCGAGFYRALWEYILQRPVKVEVIESIMNGDDRCKIAIYYKRK